MCYLYDCSEVYIVQLVLYYVYYYCITLLNILFYHQEYLRIVEKLRREDEELQAAVTKAIIDTNQTFEDMNLMETANTIKQYFHEKRGDRGVGDNSTVGAVTGGSTASDLTKMQIRKDLIMMRPPDVEKINSVIEQHKLIKQQQKELTKRKSFAMSLGSLSVTSSMIEPTTMTLGNDGNNSLAHSSLSPTVTGIGAESLRMPSITKDPYHNNNDRENKSLLTAIDDEEQSQATLSSSFISNLTNITHKAVDLGKFIATKASAVLSDDTSSRGTSEVDIRRMSAWQLFKKRKAILNDIRNAKIQLVRHHHSRLDYYIYSY